MSDHRTIQEPTVGALKDYLHYQHPSTKGDLLLNNLCDKIQQLQSQLTASQARVKELEEATVAAHENRLRLANDRIATLEQALRRAEKVITQTRQINLGVKVPNEWFILRDKALATISTALKDEISLMGTLHPAIQSMAEPALRAELAKPLSIHSEHPPMSPCDHDDCPATECLKDKKEGT